MKAGILLVFLVKYKGKSEEFYLCQIVKLLRSQTRLLLVMAL